MSKSSVAFPVLGRAHEHEVHGSPLRSGDCHKLKMGLLSHTPPRAQWLQSLSLPGNSMGLACSELSDVQRSLFLWEGAALLEDTCISSGPEVSLLPGPPGDSLALGGMSPPRGTRESGLSANMRKRQVQASQGVHSPTHAVTAKSSCGLGHRQEGAATTREKHRLMPAPQTTMWKLSVPHKGLPDTQDLCSKVLAGRPLALGPLTFIQTTPRS